MTKKKINVATQSAPGTPISAAQSMHKRGCGYPIAGGTYLAVLDAFQKNPIWNFVIDPTVPINESFISMSAIGMVLKERTLPDGRLAYDLWDWIGESAYPNVLDWLLEVQQLGFHQKVNPEQMVWISPESYYFAVHSRAGFVDPTQVYDYRERFMHPDYPKCPANHPQHLEIDRAELLQSGNLAHLGTCPGLFFNDVIRGTKPENGSRITVREMPSFSWDGFVPEGEYEHQPAAFFRFPIGRIAELIVYEDTDQHTEEKALKILEELDEKFKRVRIVPMDGG